MNDMQWRVCAEYPQYEISEYGDLRRLTPVKQFRAGRISTAQPHRGGYLLYSVSKRKKELAHRLVAKTFLGTAPSTNHQVAHNDGTRKNNHYSNLRWALPVENSADKVKHGTALAGASHPEAKLSTQAVCEIRERYAAGGQRYSGGSVTMQQLADEYGVCVTQISRIVNGQRRKTS